MATIKHISSKNADYGAAEKYLVFQHDEFTTKPILDNEGRMIPRDDYRIAAVNCDGEDFALSCIRANMKYKKNSQRQDIKSHHYIISFDPRDPADNGLTVDKAQELGMEYCRKYFPGHQALVCTHPDGHSHSGNVHVHIVINSLRIHDVERKAYMDRPCDTQAGAKHRCTASAMRHFRSGVMEMCHREGLHQIDLLNGSKEKIPEREYWAKKRGQAKLDSRNEKIISDGLTPRKTKFETEKDSLRQAVRTVLEKAVSFEDFSARLMQDYGIAVRESRGRYSYLTPERTKPVTARKLGTDFDKDSILSVLAENASRAFSKEASPQSQKDSLKHHKMPESVQNQDSIQRMIDIQAKMGEGKGKGYEWWARGFNLRQMSQTMIYLEECGFSSPEDVDTAIKDSSARLRNLAHELKSVEKKIADNKEMLRQASVYRRTRPVYDGLKKARRPEKYREQNRTDIALFEAAGRFFKGRGITRLPATADIQKENKALFSRKNMIYKEYQEQKANSARLRRVKSNIDIILKQEQTPQKRQDYER